MSRILAWGGGQLTPLIAVDEMEEPESDEDEDASAGEEDEEEEISAPAKADDEDEYVACVSARSLLTSRDRRLSKLMGEVSIKKE